MCAELLGLPAIILKHFRRIVCKCGRHDFLVRFQIPLEAPAVQVAGSHRNPIVTDGHFPVQYARLVLEDAHAAAQHLPVKPTRGIAHPRMIGQRSGHQEAHVDTAPRRSTQRLAKSAGGDEVRTHHPRAFASKFDAADHVIGNYRARGSLTERHAPGSSADQSRIRMRFRQGEMSSAAPPRPRKCLLPIRNHGTCNLDHLVAPGGAFAADAAELVGQSCAAHESQAAIDQQQLAMIAQEVVQLLAPAQRVVEMKLDTCLDQARAVRGRQPKRAEAVEHHADFHSPARGAREGGDEFVGQLTGLDQVHLKKHILARTVDRLEHASEEFLADCNEVKAVSGSPWATVRSSRERFRTPEHPATMTEATRVRL